MSTSRSRARWLRGALVGVCSAAVTLGAHTGAGGHLPSGAALVVAALVCAVVGAGLAGVTVDGRRTRLAVTSGGLLAAQLLGHLTLTVAAHDMTLPWAMAAAHLAGAILLGAAISAAEYLYAVCASVLCWLRLFAAERRQPTVRRRRFVTRHIVARSALRASGLGLRAPPRAALLPA
ncbi:Uncharacterised protein [Mycolicibacterium phlei]|uniref:hypothetical protein n=1 Tax=Mycolicibacterium phlei TaxID=1771 RepID=UPI000777E971|nr:hypothetical protein [Mycolicibacterium phlei]AMO63266.1 hypothetical protein MPHLCCUG_04480 [Mycolicibacterium phlei]KXW79576.1 membrane protein [Mycolicibacterium phlei DSM 43071]STZ21726.1 Uncharacterised protein [Mycolicibacterium phlei]VEG11363.1 Uncharacterised protein [Mycobacteroides chelonae]